MASSTTRYVDDTEPMKFSLQDDGAYRTDLSAATSLAFLAVNTSNPADTFGGSATVIEPPQLDANGIDHWNAKYAITGSDTADPGTFDCYVTVHEADGTIATYAVCTLNVKAKT